MKQVLLHDGTAYKVDDEKGDKIMQALQEDGKKSQRYFQLDKDLVKLSLIASVSQIKKTLSDVDDTAKYLDMPQEKPSEQESKPWSLQNIERTERVKLLSVFTTAFPLEDSDVHVQLGACQNLIRQYGFDTAYSLAEYAVALYDDERKISRPSSLLSRVSEVSEHRRLDEGETV